MKPHIVALAYLIGPDVKSERMGHFSPYALLLIQSKTTLEDSAISQAVKLDVFGNLEFRQGRFRD
jgi:hypothetical protein